LPLPDNKGSNEYPAPHSSRSRSVCMFELCIVFMSVRVCVCERERARANYSFTRSRSVCVFVLCIRFVCVCVWKLFSSLHSLLTTCVCVFLYVSVHENMHTFFMCICMYLRYIFTYANNTYIYTCVQRYLQRTRLEQDDLLKQIAHQNTCVFVYWHARMHAHTRTLL
jgi:hypothetical protein